jgi:hypothetical protein
MRRTPLVSLFAACLWTSACAYGITAHPNTSSAVADARYATFFVLQGNSSGSTTVDRQLRSDIEAELTDKGLVEASPEEAGAVVIVHTATPARHSRTAFYQGWGGWHWRIADPRTSNADDDYRPGTLVADVFDAWTKTLVWHGAATDRVATSAGNAHLTHHSAARIFTHFPFAGSQTASRAFGAARPTVGEQRLQIIVSAQPAVLVRIAGEPRYELVTGTDLQRVTNSRALIVRGVAGMHYLRLGDAWLEAYNLTGPWSWAGTVPDGVDVALRRVSSDTRMELFASTSRDGAVPVVYVATTPATLIVTEGAPTYEPFNGTLLMRMTNTSATIFQEPTDHELYVRLPAGWFRAWTTNGPWQQVPDDTLPADLVRVGT